MASIEWASPTKQSYILKNTIHIWKIEYSDFSGDESVLLKVLTDDELKRADKFHYKIDRKRYTVTKAFLKIILSKILSVNPVEIRFALNAHGKPKLIKPADVHFNISHSGNMGMIAVTDVAAIGVDVERYRERMTAGKAAKRFFSEKEVADFLELPEDQKLKGFFNCWTRKEAFIKALGLGLAMPLRDFDVTLKPGEKVKLTDIRKINETATDWTLKPIPLEIEYAAAFAIKSKSFEDYYWDAQNLVHF